MHRHSDWYFLKRMLVVFAIFIVPLTHQAQSITTPCAKYVLENTNNFCGCSALQFVPHGFFLESNNGCGLDYYKVDSAVFEIRPNGTAALRGIFRTFDGLWRPIYININFNSTTAVTPRLELCMTGRPNSATTNWRYFGAMSGTVQIDTAAPLSISSREGNFQVGVGANGQNTEDFGGSGYFTLSDGKRGGFSFKLGAATQGTCLLSHPCDNDTTRPTIANCPANINLTTTDNSATVTWIPPTATDNCAPTVSLSTNYASGASFPVGSTTVIYTARDTSRNVAECRFNVNVTRIDTCANDTIKPVFRNCPANVSLTTATINAIANWTPPTATDNCGTPSVSSNFPSGSNFPIGTTTVIYTARDARGNTAECRFNIVVTSTNPCDNDVTPPVFANCPQNINLSSTGGSLVVTWTVPTATDNCSTPSVSSNFPSGASFAIGSTTVIYVARDARGNTSECRFVVNISQADPCVGDRIKPVFVGCPLDILQTTTNNSTVVRWTAPTVSDNCSTPSVSSNFSSGATFPVGTTTVIYTARDAAGNTAECKFNVVVTRRTLQAGICTQYTVGNTNNICGCPEKQWMPYGLFINRPNGCGDFYKADQVTFQINGDSTARLKGIFRTNTWRPIYVDIFWTKTTQRQPRFEFCQTDSSAANDWTFFGAAQGIFRFDGEHPINITNRSQLQVGMGANGQNRDQIGASGLFSTDNGLLGSFNFVLTNPIAASCPAACVVDTVKPYFTNCPENFTQLAAVFPISVGWTAPYVDDDCASPNLAVNYLPNSNFNAGTTTVVYTARDVSGNQAECRFNVVLNRVPQAKICTIYDVDNTNNICGCSATQWKPYAFHVNSPNDCGQYFKSDSVKLTVTGENSVNVRGWFRSDTWRPIWVDINFGKTQGGRPRMDFCQNDTTAAAAWQYFGAASGTVRIDDAAPVSVSSLPNTYLQIGLGANNQNLNLFGARAVFNLGNGQQADFSMVLKNKTQVICGEISPCDFDSLPPTFSNCPANISVTTAGANAMASWTAPTVRDNCSANPSLSTNYASGSSFPIGTTTVIYTSRDSIGNSAQCRFNVVVTLNACANDTIAPTLTNCPRDINVTTMNQSVTLNWNTPTATDNCSTPTINSNFPSGSAFPIGTTTVVISARDSAGNVSQCRFNVIITFITATNDPLSNLTPIRLNYIAPNPATTFLVVDLDAQIVAEQWDFSIINTLGQMVDLQKVKLNLGNNRFSFDVSRLPKGVYFLKFNGSQKAVKFVKM